MSLAAWAALGLAGVFLLAAWSVAFTCWVELRWPRRGQQLKLPAGTVHIEARGEGVPVLYLHGAAANARDFSAAVAGKVGDGFLHLLMDRPGYGYSPGGRARRSLRAQAQLAAEALERLAGRSAILVGHGAGAAVALRLALERPELAAGLVLIAPLAFGGEAPTPFVSRLAAGLGPLFTRVWLPLAAPLLAQNLVSDRFQPVRAPRAFARKGGAALGLRPFALAADHAARRRLAADCAEQAARYHEIAARTIVLTAEADPWADPARHARPLYAVLPRAELVVIPGAGHMAHQVRPAAAAAAVRRLAGLTGLLRPQAAP